MATIDDLQVRQDILDELEWDPRIDARNIGVAIEDGIVTLTGRVSSYSEKTDADKIVKRVYGVRGVANDLEVTLAATAERNDTDIARSAASAIDWSASLPKDRVKVGVSEGWVTLDGDVDWHYQKRVAEDAVRDLKGVRGVTDKIVVKASMNAGVEDVRTKIEAALKRNAELDAKKIEIDLTDGGVTLRGSVRSWVEREDAVNAAWSAPGVTNVIDQIRIQP